MTFILPILVIGSLGVAFYFALEYARVSANYKKLLSSQEKLKNADYLKRRAEKILETAQDRYQQIIDASYKKAEKILTDAKVFNEDTRAQVLEELGTSIKTISQEIKSQALDEVKDFGKELQEEVVTSKQAAQEVISEDYDKVNSEIQAYKHQQLAEIDAKVEKLIKDVVAKYLGEALNEKQQTDILVKVLDDAKHQL